MKIPTRRRSQRSICRAPSPETGDLLLPIKACTKNHGPRRSPPSKPLWMGLTLTPGPGGVNSRPTRAFGLVVLVRGSGTISGSGQHGSGIENMICPACPRSAGKEIRPGCFSADEGDLLRLSLLCYKFPFLAVFSSTRRSGSALIDENYGVWLASLHAVMSYCLFPSSRNYELPMTFAPR